MVGMKASTGDQKTLLELVELDLSLSRNASEVSKLRADDELEKASELTLELSDQLIDLRNRVSDLEFELKRSEDDLELVEKRIAKDKQRLATTSSSKDAQGIEHELGALAKRKNELEDAELEIMEKLDGLRIELAKTTEQKSDAEIKLDALRNSVSILSTQLETQKMELSSKRNSLIEKLDAELAAAYSRKADRGVAVGKLVGRECGACRLSITATSLDEILALPLDEVAECPNCQAFLVRS